MYATWTVIIYTWSLQFSCAHEQKAHGLGAHTVCIVSMVDGRGYDCQQEDTICDACRPCYLIRSALMPILGQVRLIRCAYESLTCLHLEIWRLFVDKTMTWLIIPCTYVRDKKFFLGKWLMDKVSIYIYRHLHAFQKFCIYGRGTSENLRISQRALCQAAHSYSNWLWIQPVGNKQLCNVHCTHPV